MSSEADYKQLDDPAFFAERRHVREKLEQLPGDHPGRAALEQLYDEMNAEFDRRARAAWNQPAE